MQRLFPPFWVDADQHIRSGIRQELRIANESGNSGESRYNGNKDKTRLLDN